MIIVGAILVVTAVALGVKLAGKSSEVSSPQVPVSKPPTTAPKAGSPSAQNVTSADPEVQALETDLNSVSEEDFGEDSLSDAEVGL